MPDQPIRVSTQTEKWRFECPEGHKDWRVWDGVFSCETCRRHRSQGESVESTVYEFLVDQATGEHVRREDLEIALDAQNQAPTVGD